MKVRIKFAKSGIARFIGHLDVMRYFQKAVRRAGIAIRYSGGFSPHQLMSFAAPLGVGITSNGEYLDIEVEDDEDTATMKARLNQVMAEGFSVKSCLVLPKEAGNAMSLVAAARYTVAFRPGCMPQNPEEWFAGLISFYDRDRVNIIKKTKKGAVIVLVGYSKSGEMTLPMSLALDKELTFKTVFRYRHIYPMAIDAVAAGKVNLKGIVTDVFDLDDVQNAMDHSVNNKADIVKAVIRIAE